MFVSRWSSMLKTLDIFIVINTICLRNEKKKKLVAQIPIVIKWNIIKLWRYLFNNYIKSKKSYMYTSYKWKQTKKYLDIPDKNVTSLNKKATLL